MRTAPQRLEVRRPQSLTEALAMLGDFARAGHALAPLAGGTDLLVGLNMGGLVERRFLDVWKLEELRYLRLDSGAIAFGALATWTDAIRSPLVNRLLPILVEAGREMGAAQVRNRATLAGNVGNGSPAGDALPILAACDTTVILQSADRGRREVRFAEFYTGYRKTVRRPDELIVELRVRVPEGVQRFRKVGTRAAQAIGKLVMAQVGNRVALGCVAPTVMRAKRLEAWMAGGGRDPEEGRRVLEAEIAPIDDLRSSAAYRRKVAGNVIARWLA